MLSNLAPRTAARRAAVHREREQFEALQEHYRHEERRSAAASRIQFAYRRHLMHTVVVPRRVTIRAVSTRWSFPQLFDYLVAKQNKVEGEVCGGAVGWAATA